MAKTRLSNKRIEDVVRSVCGDDVLPLVKKILGKENVSEFKLAEQLKEDIKRVRNVLYRLYEANLVEFSRKKDKKKGWYIYFWTFKPEQIKFLYGRIKRQQLENLREKLKSETKEQFFICPNSCARMSFEQAVDFEYCCPECGELTQQEEIDEQLDDVRKMVILLEKELKQI